MYYYNFNCNIIAFTAAAIPALQCWKSPDHQQNLFKLFTIILMCPSKGLLLIALEDDARDFKIVDSNLVFLSLKYFSYIPFLCLWDFGTIPSECGARARLSHGWLIDGMAVLAPDVELRGYGMIDKRINVCK